VADIEEYYLTPDEETEAERTRRKANKRKVMFASTRSCADKLTMKFRPFEN
jgi:hypothetical protein